MSKQAVFVHHDQAGGKTSTRSQEQAWAHIGRRAWRGDPRKLRIKMWLPKTSINDSLSDDNESVDEDTPAELHRKLKLLYDRTAPRIYGNRSLITPEHLNLVQTTIFAVAEHSRRCSSTTAWFPPESQALIDKVRVDFMDFQFAIICGVNGLRSRRYKQAFASFEYGARLCQQAITQNTIHGLDTFFPSFLAGILYAAKRGATDVVKLFLRQVSGLVAVAAGTIHPVYVATKNLQALDITAELMYELATADNEEMRNLDPLTKECYQFEEKCEFLGNKWSLQEAQSTFDRIAYHHTQGKEGRYAGQFNTGGMAELYMAHEKFAEAESLLSNAASDYSEWIERGWKSTLPRTAPLSVIGMVWRITLLAQAKAGLQEHDASDRFFQLSIQAAKSLLPADHPSVVRAQKAYSMYLVGQRRSQDAEVIEQQIDEALSMYMLTNQA